MGLAVLLGRTDTGASVPWDSQEGTVRMVCHDEHCLGTLCGSVSESQANMYIQL